jgi:hypothetical protein
MIHKCNFSNPETSLRSKKNFTKFVEKLQIGGGVSTAENEAKSLHIM